MKTHLTHENDEATLAITAVSDKEKQILHHLMFGLAGPDALRRAISDSDTDFANSLTEDELQMFRDIVANPGWRGKPILTKQEIQSVGDI